VLISAGTLSGFEFGPGSLNPYEQFQQVAPSHVIQHGVFVFDGHFDIPLAAALNHMQKSQNLLAAKQLAPALNEAQTAVSLAPNSVDTQLMLGDVLASMDQPGPARSAYTKALQLSQTIEPDFQTRRLPGIHQRLESLGP